MPLRLYNTFSKHEEKFVPQVAGKVSMYTCGPTVYGRPHIGNYSSFLMADLLRRWLEVSGYKVSHVKNITDVGHLVADQDDGEDKIEKQAKAESSADSAKKSVTKDDVFLIVQKYTDQFLEDEKNLNMLEPMERPRASDYVAQMIELIKTLIEKGNAYETEDGVYFSVETFKNYGKLSGNTLDKLDAGSRILVDEAKRHPADFAVWKKCVGKNAAHVLRWTSPWGEGFPGWHIECSAMASALLGTTIDIHTGGEDNIFPHHECEIAQSECAFGTVPFARMWLHKRRIDLLGEKMSKSLGNVLSLPSITEKGYSPLDLRYYFLSVHYRTNLKFSWKGMDDAKISRNKIVEVISQVEQESPAAEPGKTDAIINETLKGFSDDFSRAMDQDLNTPGALAAAFDFVHFFHTEKTKRGGFTKDEFSTMRSFTKKVRDTFGCFEPEAASEIPSDVQSLVGARAAARTNKDFKESDRLRDAIKALGYEVRDDAKTGQVVKKT